MDGATYAAVARNLATDAGSMWDLFYTPNLYPHFVEHPPLHLWLQSLVFIVLGDHWWIEDAFGLVMWIVTAWGLDRLGEKMGLSPFQILAAMLMWTLIPVIYWGYSNNLLETSLSAWMVWSTYFTVVGIRSQKLFPLVIAGIFISAGVLTKGPVALFPLAVPFIWFIVDLTKPSWKWVHPTLIVFLGFAAPLIALFWLRDAQDYFIRYWNKQILQSLDHVQTVNNRWYLPFQFVLQLGIPIGLVVVSQFRKGSQKITFPTLSKPSLVLWAIALSAVFPMMISLKQRDFYLIPAMGFAALALATMIKDSRMKHILAVRRYYSCILLLCLGTGLIARFIPAVTRSERATLMNSIQEISKSRKGQTFYVAPELLKNWNLIAQCARFGPIYFKPKPIDKKLEGPELIYTNGRVYLKTNDESP